MTVSLQPIVIDLEVIQGQFPIVLDISGIGSKGEKGDKGDKGDGSLTIICGEDLSGHTAISIGADGRAYKATSLDNKPIVGISLNAAIVDEPIEVKFTGQISHPGWSFIVDEVVSLNIVGQLTTSEDPMAQYTSVVGVANSPSSLVIAIQSKIKLA